MLNKLNKKIVKIIRTGLLIIIICINCIIVINTDVSYADEVNAAEFKIEDNIIHATNFKLK